MTGAPYRLWVNTERTLLVRQWPNGTVEIAERDSADHVWRAPVEVRQLPSWIENLTEEEVA